MSQFKVYPKKGEPLNIQCERIEFDDHGFILHGSNGDLSQDRAFLSVDNIAAIIPEHQQEHSDAQNLATFRVYLRNRNQSDKILVTASVFDAKHKPNISFSWQRFGSGLNVENIPVGDVYIASSEVVFIIPGNL